MMSLKADPDPSKPAAKPAKDKPGVIDQQMGASLRSVYQATVEEQIPQEMLDLLGKLD